MTKILDTPPVLEGTQGEKELKELSIWLRRTADLLNDKLQDISVRVTKTANQSINNAAPTVVTWDVEVFDTDAMHDNVTNNTRITINKPGKYMVGATVGFAPSATGLRLVDLFKNTSQLLPSLIIQSPNPNAGASSYFTCSALVDLVATDFLEIFARQDSGGALAVNADSIFWAVKMN